MLFGDRDTFAIEAMVEPDLKPPSPVWGRIRVWCEGRCIGDYDEPYCALYDSYRGFQRLERELSSLWRPEFEGLGDFELWDLLDGALYGCGDDPRSFDEMVRDRRTYGACDFLTNWSPSFDGGGKSFIVLPPGGDVHILNGVKLREQGAALQVPPDQVLTAIRAYVVWFEEQAAALGYPVVGT